MKEYTQNKKAQTTVSTRCFDFEITQKNTVPQTPGCGVFVSYTAISTERYNGSPLFTHFSFTFPPLVDAVPRTAQKGHATPVVSTKGESAKPYTTTAGYRTLNAYLHHRR